MKGAEKMRESRGKGNKSCRGCKITKKPPKDQNALAPGEGGNSKSRAKSKRLHDKWLPLHPLAASGAFYLVDTLLKHNVDINAVDKDGWTPLHLAVQAQRIDVIKLLLIKGADKTLKNKDGLTPLNLCLYYSRDTRTYELIKVLKLLPKQR
ncbi:Ankyrin repeat domain-containing protein [Morus notabilis]|uniref:Ankyrin repeat domain-containing protein n=1 Tax=Morus notabilis TaxID=981085 RepID=W9QEP5_9ROSA|nr:Ankyrin repeat domain-containing protein [Morus notabilis]